MKLTLPQSTGLVRAPTKTIAFTGASGLGAAGSTTTVYTITGRVKLVYGSIFCTETLVSASNLGTISMGVAADVEAYRAAIVVGAGTIAANDWWGAAGDTMAGLGRDWVTNADAAEAVNAFLSQDIIIDCLTQNTTDGTLVIDCWYIPLTAGASLT